VKLEPARDAILRRIPRIGAGRAYQLARILRGTGVVIRIGRRLYVEPDRLDAVLAAGFPTQPQRPAA